MTALAGVADPYRLSRTVGFDLEGADGVRSGPRPARRRRDHDAGHRTCILDQTDHHDEVAISGDELERPVERIDEENARRADPTGECALVALFGHDGDRTERFGKARADEGVGLAIRGGDRIGGALVVDGELGCVDALDDEGSLARDRQHDLELVGPFHVTTPARARSLASCPSASLVR